jgi:GntR family transcriptional regulator, transcriptional repressor for pyruvate dehydrogenase complex
MAPEQEAAVAEASEPFVKPIRPVRTFESAIDEIVRGIEQAGLRTGDALPNETKLAKQLGISKPTLRQALRVLERSGLVDVRRGKVGGIFMASDFLPMDEISRSLAIEEDAAVRVLRARRAMEIAVNAEAVYAATDEDFAAIERTIELLHVPKLDSDRILRADGMFHRSVALATHNDTLIEAHSLVHRRQSAIRHEQLGSEAERVERLHSSHFEALVSRDPEAVAVAVDTHLHFLEDMVAEGLSRPWEELFSPGAPFIRASGTDAS